MGRVPTASSAQFKGHQGLPSSPADFDSIEAAVKGQMNNPPASIGDFDTLVALANWQLLDEQSSSENGTPILRGQQPTSYGQFHGFPKVTISVSELVQSYNTEGDLFIDFNITTNNRVGYAIEFPFDFSVGTTLTPPSNGGDGLTSHSFVLNAGSTFVACSFYRANVAQGKEWSISKKVLSHSVYNESLIDGFAGIAQNSSPNLSNRSVKPNNYGGAFCYNPNDPFEFQSDSFSHYLEGFSVGSKVWANSIGTTPAINGSYIESDGEFTYSIINGQISEIIFCQ